MHLLYESALNGINGSKKVISAFQGIKFSFKLGTDKYKTLKSAVYKAFDVFRSMEYGRLRKRWRKCFFLLLKREIILSQTEIIDTI